MLRLLIHRGFPLIEICRYLCRRRKLASSASRVNYLLVPDAVSSQMKQNQYYSIELWQILMCRGFTSSPQSSLHFIYFQLIRKLQIVVIRQGGLMSKVNLYITSLAREFVRWQYDACILHQCSKFPAEFFWLGVGTYCPSKPQCLLKCGEDGIPTLGPFRIR
jgi:hypothetical protein